MSWDNVMGMEESIVHIHGREVLDSRGNPTVEAEVALKSGIVSRASVPSGASTGVHEAVELRDKAKAFRGKGVKKAIRNVKGTIARRLQGMNPLKQQEIDRALLDLDGTTNKRKLGANAMLAVSLAASRAAALAQGLHDFEHLLQLTRRKPLIPIPFCNVINGGKHATGKLKPQEFMIVPTGAKSFAQATQMVAETYYALKERIITAYGPGAANVGDEGGFAPPLNTPEEALDLLLAAIKDAGYKGKLQIALDPAASEFYQRSHYDLGHGRMAPEKLVEYWSKLVKKYPIISLEDPFEQDDYAPWRLLRGKKRLPCQIVGDDLTVTNPTRISMASEQQLCNALLLKVNQVGTLTEALEAAHRAFAAGWNVMVSHRSGETEDHFISDLAVALGCGQIKLGAPCRSDRVAKCNQLLRIEEYLGKRVKYARFALPKG